MLSYDMKRDFYLNIDFNFILHDIFVKIAQMFFFPITINASIYCHINVFFGQHVLKK